MTKYENGNVTSTRVRLLYEPVRTVACLFVKFNITVDAVKPVKMESGWHGLAWDITSSDGIDPNTSVQRRFDAVLVCNGFVHWCMSLFQKRNAFLSWCVLLERFPVILCKSLMLSVFHQTLL